MCKERNPLRGMTERMVRKLSPVFEHLRSLGVLLDRAGEEKLAESIMELRRPARIESIGHQGPGGELYNKYRVWAPYPNPTSGDLKMIGEGDDIAQAMLSARGYYDYDQG